MTMNFHAILFVFVSCQLYPYHKSSVDCLENQDGDRKEVCTTSISSTVILQPKKSDDSVLTQDTIEAINNQFNEEGEETKKRIRNLMKEKRRADAEKIQQAKLEATKGWKEATRFQLEATKGWKEATRFQQEATRFQLEATKGWKEATRFQLESKKLQKETFYQLFSCAVSTIKAFMNKRKDEKILWKNLNISSFDSSTQSILFDVKFPQYIVDLILKYDGPAPFGITKFKHAKYHEKRFISLYIRLKTDMFEKSHYFEKLRTLIKQEYKPENDKKTDEVYQLFAATITRDNNFFAGQHRTELVAVLDKIRLAKSTGEQDVLDNLFSINPNWYLDETHIKNINILMRAYYDEEPPQIFGYKCKNGVGKEIEIPLLDNCGYRRDFTYRPEKLALAKYDYNFET